MVRLLISQGIDRIPHSCPPALQAHRKKYYPYGNYTGNSSDRQVPPDVSDHHSDKLFFKNVIIAS